MTIIQFKRGTTGPTGLTLGEPAWEYDDNRFYIGVTSDAIWIGAGITTGDIANNSSLLIPTQSAVKSYVDANVGSSIAGVTSVNGLTGALTITGGTGISVTQGPNNILIKNILGAGFILIEGITFTGTTVYNIPSGAKLIFGNCIGAGGGGAAGGITQSRPGDGGGGGAGGAYYEFVIPDVQSIGATCQVTIGAGGLGSTTLTAGSDGGMSQFAYHTFAGSAGGIVASSTATSNLGYMTNDPVVSTTTYFAGQGVVNGAPVASICAGAGGANRTLTNNVGYDGRAGYKGGGGGGGGAPTSSNSYKGGRGSISSNIPSDVATSGLTAWFSGRSGGDGGTGSSVGPASAGLQGSNGTLEYGGAGGGGGGSSLLGIAGNGGDGGYPGGGGGGGGGSRNSSTRAPGGTGGDARIMIWVYG